MTLDPLASTDDLTARNIAVPGGVNAASLLNAASDAVRDAAGCQITYGESTIVLVVDDPCEIDLPAGPVAGVSAVMVAGSPVTGWSKIGDTLIMQRTRWTECLPVEVTVTYTHGYPVVPADIVDLVCAVTSMSFADSGDGYGGAGRLGSFKLGEFSETYIHPAGTDSPSPVALPDSVRARLRARFGGAAVVIKVH